MKQMLLAAAAALAFVAAPASSNQFYVFGDSLVDAGNIFVATGGTVPSPAQGYFQGRFNEGYDFTDYLQRGQTGVPTTASLLGGTNFAWGGARAMGPASGGVQVPGLPQQLGAYLAASGGVGDPNGIYVLNFGGNDVFGINSGDTGGLTPMQAGALVVSNMVSAVTTLSSIGAGNILVMGIPNGDATGFAVDAALQSALDAVEPTLAANLFRYSYFGFYNRVLSNPASYGYPANTDFSTPCIAARPVVNGSINCTGYFGFDG
ncbi:MAG: SGNH/GDSL hydrolase family protein, partial [Polymorphobacter sp.]